MIIQNDLKVDEADDILIDETDIALETDIFVSATNNGKRRLSARKDDFLLTNIGAGLGVHLGSRDSEITQNNIESDSRMALTRNELFSNSEFDVITNKVLDDKKMPVIIRFTDPDMEESNEFKVIINQHNQRYYK